MLSLLTLLSACHGPDAPPGTGSSDHVVLLVVDGIRLDESLGESGTSLDGRPVTDHWPEVRTRLYPEGTRVETAWNAGITITSPAHCNLSTGARVPVGNFVATSGLGYYVPDIPTLFEALQTARGQSGVLLGNTDLIAPMGYSAYPGLGPSVGAALRLVTDEDGSDRRADDDEPVLAAVLDVLRTEAPPLVVANLHATDRAGHEGTEEDYLTRANDVDAALAGFWRDVQRDETLADHTVVVILADHGRHTNTGQADEWRNHGESCTGCRAIPMLWLGPGVAGGRTVSGNYTLDDVATTVAALLGAPLPFGEGRRMVDVVSGITAGGPTGESDVVTAAGLVGVRRWTGEDAARSEVVVDEAVLSAPDAWAAEALAVAGGTDADGNDVRYACWREMRWDRTATKQPWLPRCARNDGAGWEDIGGPAPEVGAAWAPALAVDDQGRLLVVATTSVSGAVADEDPEGDVRAGIYTPGEPWSVPSGGVTEVSFTSSTAALPSPDGAWVAFGASDPGAGTGRFTRHVEVHAVTLAGPSQTWTPLYAGQEQADEEGGLWERREWPDLMQSGDRLYLSQVGYGEEGTTVLVNDGPTAGGAWTHLRRLDFSGRVLPFPAPRWGGGRLYWARVDKAGLVQVCAQSLTATEPTCAATGYPRIRGLAAFDDGVWISADTGEGAWVTESLPLDPP